MENNLTLEQVGNSVGVGKSTVRKWEIGTIANMRCDKIAALAKTLHTTSAYLMGWEEEEPAPEVKPDSFLYAISAKSQVLTEENKVKLLEIADFFIQQQEKKQKNS